MRSHGMTKWDSMSALDIDQLKILEMNCGINFKKKN